MSWISDVLASIGTFLKSDNSKEWGALTHDLKELKDEWKDEFKNQKRVNTALRIQLKTAFREIDELRAEVLKLRESEEECLQNQVKLAEEVRLYREQIIFLTQGRHKGTPDENDLYEP